MKAIARYIMLLWLPIAATAQWQILDPQTNADLRGVDYAGDGVVWISGSHGTVRRSEDMGFVWQACSIPPGAEKLDFRAIQGFSNNVALVMSSGTGEESRIYKTTDGCQSWKLMLTNPDKEGFWDSMRFAEKSKRGYLIGDPVGGRFAVFHTEDGGDTWARGAGMACNANELTAKAGEGIFAASNEELVPVAGGFSFVSGGSTARFGTCRHGLTDFVDLPVAQGTAAAGAFAFGITGERMVVVGGDYQKATVSEKSAAMGEPWHLSAAMPSGYRSGVDYDKARQRWIAVGPNGTDMSMDGGNHWQPLAPLTQDRPGSNTKWNAISFPFAVGPQGRVGLFETGKQ